MFKTNDTKDRVNYGSLLCPPDGFTLQFAVGTTYSLDLEALTAVCLSLGLAEDTDSTLRQNPVAMLRALQTVTEKMLIFCEAGQIKMPKTPQLPEPASGEDNRSGCPAQSERAWPLSRISPQNMAAPVP